MNFYISLPVLFLKFFFLDVPKELVLYFLSLNRAFMQLFSLTLLIKTFFRPWKNEYRKDLVIVAIGIGMVIKSLVIIADLFLFSALLLLEFVILAAFILWPIATVTVLFLK